MVVVVGALESILGTLCVWHEILLKIKYIKKIYFNKMTTVYNSSENCNSKSLYISWIDCSAQDNIQTFKCEI